MRDLRQKIETGDWSLYTISAFIDMLPLTKYDAPMTDQEVSALISACNDIEKYGNNELSKNKMETVLGSLIGSNIGYREMIHLCYEYDNISIWEKYINKIDPGCITSENISKLFADLADKDECNLNRILSMASKLPYASYDLSQLSLNNLKNQGAIQYLYRNRYHITCQNTTIEQLIDAIVINQSKLIDVAKILIQHANPKVLEIWEEKLLENLPIHTDVAINLLGNLVFNNPFTYINKITQEIRKIPMDNLKKPFEYGNIVLQNPQNITAQNVYVILNRMDKTGCRLTCNVRWIEPWIYEKTLIEHRNFIENLDKLPFDITYVTSDDTRIGGHRIFLDSKMKYTLPVFHNQKTWHVPWHSDHWKYVIDYVHNGKISCKDLKTLSILLKISVTLGIDDMFLVLGARIAHLITSDNYQDYLELANSTKNIWMLLKCFYLKVL